MTTPTIQPDPMTVEIERQEAHTGHRFLRVTVNDARNVCRYAADYYEGTPWVEPVNFTTNERSQLEALIAQEWEAWK